jgi:hypothetical protein
MKPLISLLLLPLLFLGGCDLLMIGLNGLPNCEGYCMIIGWDGSVQAALPKDTKHLGAMQYYQTYDRSDPYTPALERVIIKIDGITVHNGLGGTPSAPDKPEHLYKEPLLSSHLVCGEHTWFISRDYGIPELGWDAELSGSWCIEDDTCPGACSEDDGDDDVVPPPPDNGVSIALILFFAMIILFGIAAIMFLKKK